MHSHPIRYSSRLSFVVLGAVLVGFAIRIYRLDAQSFWGDEILQATVAERSIPAILEWVRRDRGPTPLSYLLLHEWIGLVGQSDFALRLLPVFFGVLTVPLQYQFSRRLLGESGSVLAALILALSSFHVAYSQELRAYSLLVFFSLLEVLSFWQVLRAGGWWRWALTGLIAGIGFYNHPYILVVLGFLVLFGALTATSLTVRAVLPKTVRPSGPPSTILKGIGLMLLVVFVLTVPWVFYVGDLARAARWGNVSLTVEYVVRSLLKARDALLTTSPPWALLMAFAWLVGMWRLFRQSYPLVLLLAGWTLLPIPAFILITGLVGDYPLTTRQLLICLPPFYTVSAAGLVMITSQIAKWRRAPFRLLPAVLLVGASVLPLADYYATPKEDWRSVGRYLSRVVAEDEAIIVPRVAHYVRYYYDGPPAKLLAPKSVQEMNAALDTHKGVWFVWSSYINLGSRQTSRDIQAFLKLKTRVEVFNHHHRIKILYLNPTGHNAAQLRTQLREQGRWP